MRTREREKEGKAEKRKAQRPQFKSLESREATGLLMLQGQVESLQYGAGFSKILECSILENTVSSF